MLEHLDTAKVTMIDRNSPLTPGPLSRDAVLAPDAMYLLSESPFRPVDWRWRLAQRSLVQQMPLRPELADPWVLRIKMHLQSGHEVPESRVSQGETSIDRVLAEAASIRFAADPLIGGELEAWILTGEPRSALAEVTGYEVPVIEAYEKCFYDVRPKLDASGYVNQILIGPGLRYGFHLDDLAPIWKLIAYHRGRYTLAVTLQAFPGSRVRPWPDWYPASPEHQAELIELCRRVVHVRCMPREVATIEEVILILKSAADAQAHYEKRYGPLGAAGPPPSSDDISPGVGMVETDEPAASPPQSSTGTVMGTVPQTA